MKRIDFEQLGGLPLKQPTLDFMQQSYDDTQRALLDWMLVPGDFLGSESGGDVIIAGIEEGTQLGVQILTPGWIVRDGELLRFAGSPLQAVINGGGIGIQAIADEVTFKDGSTKNVYFRKNAVAGGENPLALNKFRRLMNLTNLRPVLAYMVQREVGVIPAGALSSMVISSPLVKVGDVVAVSITEGVAPGTGLGLEYAISDWVSVSGRVDVDGQVVISIINHSPDYPAFGGYITLNIRVLK